MMPRVFLSAELSIFLAFSSCCALLKIAARNGGKEQVETDHQEAVGMKTNAG
jgi:hypothetical protein